MAPKDRRINENELSARDVLEKIGLEIYKEIEKTIPHKDQLVGTLSKAEFADGFYRGIGWGVRTGYNDSCGLHHKYNTNIIHVYNDGRNPCHGRQQKRFGENAESYCNSDKIRGNENNSNAGACAPFRRQNLCDRNLEYLINENTNTTHDLLGNVLVTAKYEGDIIVNNHPDKDIKGNKSSICTSLARSFADIGDIVRGRDMFKRNNHDNVENGLREVFKKIHEDLSPEVQKHYKDDGSVNYYKLREDWWNANRDQVWKAITCKAPQGADYFRKGSDGSNLFSNNGPCGRNETDVPTNLDYVPQFLRWFEEWSEEFCRKRKIKLEKIKNACYNKEKKIYCSHNGYDCIKMSWKKDIESREYYCTGCFSACSLYKIWIGKQKEEFEKQKEKYKNEIQKYVSETVRSNSTINNEYYNVYKNFNENNYETNNNFLNLLNEGKYCKEKLQGEENVDFTKTGEKGIFSHSKDCKVCPYCGLACVGTECTAKEEIYPDCVYNGEYDPPKDVRPTEINVIDSGNEVDISKKLSEFCSNENKENIENYQKWKCYYTNSEDIDCEMTSISQKDQKISDVKTFYNFFDLWVKNLLRDSIKWETELKGCINNTNVTDCKSVCNVNCECFDKWVKQKEKEWDSIKKLLKKKKNVSKKCYTNINKNFDIFFFRVMYELNNEEAKWNKLMENLRTKINSSKKNKRTKDSEGAIKVLFDHLKETATICKDNNTNEACVSSQNATTNPCAKSRDYNKHATVKQIAQYYKRIAHKQLNERAGRSALKGDATKGKYMSSLSEKRLYEICKITKDNSNAKREFSKHPCAGKDREKKLFELKDVWKTGTDVQMSHKDVFMPPRREHFCTSNLEFLDTDYIPFIYYGAKVINDSFLGDVLLSAKSEADKIIDMYPKNNGQNDKEGICRAIRYSFADIGDIIKGTDLWEANPGEKNTQRRLETVFGKIKKQFNGKYTHEEAKPPYRQLRADWWEANRHQVWKAMKCAIKEFNDTSVSTQSNGYCGYSDHTPLDDYIPQRLRWMTEWAEWYCKMQKEAYDKLKQDCIGCTGKDRDCNKSGKCGKCTISCENYKKFINTWQTQWKEMEQKYESLYKEAQENDNSSHKSTTEQDKYVVEFLSQLQKANNGDKTGVDTVYSTAAGYVHQEAPYMECQGQKHFCDEKHEEYAFKNPPNGYDV
ncbi:hypothetical protein PFMALIP_06258, partial [Plasmodium falciparum MaliPS096_E11]